MPRFAPPTPHPLVLALRPLGALALLTAVGCTDLVGTSDTVDDGMDDGTADSANTGDGASGTDDGVDDADDSVTATDAGDPDTGGSDTGPPDEGCPTAAFPTPMADPANAGYPDPTLEVYCTETELVIESNGIPSYEFQPITPNDLQAQNNVFHIPLEPVEAPAPATIPLLGVVAAAVNGMPIFGPNEAAIPDPFGDPIYNGIMDFCLGHTAMMGDYHYHGLLVECLVGEVPAGDPSPIVAFSLDGYPIYGPVGCLDAECTEVVTFQSGWQQTGDPSTYAWDNHAYVASEDPTVLDECNGRMGPDGTYRYHATDSFPYVLGCYRGEANAGQ
jgi:hypothetical protein